MYMTRTFQQKIAPTNPMQSLDRFCASTLWLRQVLQEFPAAIAEKDFCVPGDTLLSHSERRNLTDLQETSQWLGGTAVARCVLKSLMSTLLDKVYPFYLASKLPIFHFSPDLPA